MGCCDKIKHLSTKASNIVQGHVREVLKIKYEFTDDRITICRNCEPGRFWIGKTLWCKICKCRIPAKARVESEKCPLGKWSKETNDV